MQHRDKNQSLKISKIAQTSKGRVSAVVYIPPSSRGETSPSNRIKQWSWARTKKNSSLFSKVPGSDRWWVLISRLPFAPTRVARHRSTALHRWARAVRFDAAHNLAHGLWRSRRRRNIVEFCRAWEGRAGGDSRCASTATEARIPTARSEVRMWFCAEKTGTVGDFRGMSRSPRRRAMSGALRLSPTHARRWGKVAAAAWSAIRRRRYQSNQTNCLSFSMSDIGVKGWGVAKRFAGAQRSSFGTIKFVDQVSNAKIRAVFQCRRRFHAFQFFGCQVKLWTCIAPLLEGSTSHQQAVDHGCRRRLPRHRRNWGWADICRRLVRFRRLSSQLANPLFDLPRHLPDDASLLVRTRRVARRFGGCQVGTFASWHGHRRQGAFFRIAHQLQPDLCKTHLAVVSNITTSRKLWNTHTNAPRKLLLTAGIERSTLGRQVGQTVCQNCMLRNCFHSVTKQRRSVRKK